MIYKYYNENTQWRSYSYLHKHRPSTLPNTSSTNSNQLSEPRATKPNGATLTYYYNTYKFINTGTYRATIAASDPTLNSPSNNNPSNDPNYYHPDQL